MATFRCARFPEGAVPIRTPSGVVVDFHDGIAEVDDPEVAASLLEVPPVFRISRVGGGSPTPPPEPDPGTGHAVPDGMSVPTTMTWVGTDRDRAELALSAEKVRPSPRATLIARLEALLDG